MTLRTASCFTPAGRSMTDAELTTLSQRNDIVLACGDGTIPHLYKRKAFAYGRPFKADNSWTKWINDNGGWAEWIKGQHLDGLFVDCAFEDFGGTDFYDALFDLQVPLIDGPNVKPICINFGDFDSWTMRRPANPAWKDWIQAAQAAPWHFVQNAYDVSRHTEARWRDLKSAANVRLAAGKTLVLGLYNPNGVGAGFYEDEMEQKAMLAALLSQSFEHERLFYHYYSDASCSSGVDDQFNPFWSLSR